MIVEVYNALEAQPEAGEYLSRLVDANDDLEHDCAGWELASAPADTREARQHRRPHSPRWTANDEWLWYAGRYLWMRGAWRPAATLLAKAFRVDRNDAIVGLDVAGLSLHDYHILVAMVRVAVDRLREKGWRR